MLQALLKQTAVAQKILYALDKQSGVERFGDVFVGIGLEAFEFRLPCVESREQYHRDMAELNIALYIETHLRSAHHGHHDVGNDDIRIALLRFLQSFGAVGSRFGAIQPGEDPFEVMPQLVVVFNDEDKRFPAGGFGGAFLIIG